MGKRFYDTEMFNKQWFRKLKPKHKAFWFYVLCSCDIAGIIELDLEASEFFIGEKILIDEINEIFKNQLIKIDEKRYFVNDFVQFQNGNNLNFKSPVHAKIINILEKYRLYDRVLNRVCNTPVVLVGVIVEEEVKEIVEVGVVPEKKTFPVSYPYDSENFLNTWDAWKKYLIEVGKPYQTFSSEQAALQFLSEFTELESIEILKTAIKNQWKNLRKIEKNGNKDNFNERKASVVALSKLANGVLQGFKLNDDTAGT